MLCQVRPSYDVIGSVTKMKHGVVKLLMESRDAHYKLLFDDSAFLFNQREKKFCRLLGTLHSD